MNRATEKLIWKPGTMVYPAPAVLVTCGDIRNKTNIITISWAGNICTDPPMCSISIRPERHSYPIIRHSGEFVVNLTTASLASVTDWCGVKSGRDHDKFRETGLTPLPAEFVRAPLIAESPVNLECRVSEIKELGSHHLFIAAVLAVHADPDFFRRKSGYFDLAAADPLCYCHGFYHHLGGAIGKFGFSVEKRKKSRRRPIRG